ncbi:MULTISPECIES: TRADD-N-associated membrane domain-containing protein [Micromonospora]|uniref:TRADD-N-associated membrane domain-containing protein n=1 Tax=Micromonospora TaxID=1873 RepID=UPI00340893F4
MGSTDQTSGSERPEKQFGSSVRGPSRAFPEQQQPTDGVQADVADEVAAVEFSPQGEQPASVSDSADDHLQEIANRLESDTAWLDSAERRRLIRISYYVGGLVVPGGIVVGFATYVLAKTINPSAYYYESQFRNMAAIVAGVYAAAVLYLGLFFLFQERLRARRMVRDRLLLAKAKKEVRKAEDALVEHKTSAELDLVSLWALTHRRLDYYHELATRQADTSFRNAQFAMTAGFAILALAVVLMLLPTSTAGRLIMGSLGAVAALLGGYIGNTFLRSQENAASHLRAYFLQPLEFSRYLVAERLAASLSTENRDSGFLEIIRGISGVPVEHERE